MRTGQFHLSIEDTIMLLNMATNIIEAAKTIFITEAMIVPQIVISSKMIPTKKIPKMKMTSVEKIGRSKKLIPYP